MESSITDLGCIESKFLSNGCVLVYPNVEEDRDDVEGHVVDVLQRNLGINPFWDREKD